MEQTVFEAAGGQPAMDALAHAWHARCLADPVVSHAFSHGFHPDHSARLAAYWSEALGGPGRFSETVGDQSYVQRLHAGNGEHEEMDRRAIACFVQALDDAGLPDDERLRRTLVDYFTWGVELMAAHPRSPDDVPAGLGLPRWSWDGLADNY
jgi:hemoglobin